MKSDYSLPLDPWMAASLMQKAIRRGEQELAARAAATYFRLRGTMVWRRFVIIAFEDIGVADPDLVAHVTRLSVDSDLRREIGSDLMVVAELARSMASAAKDRSADYIISAIKYHPDWEEYRAQIAPLSVRQRIQLAVDPSRPLPLRSVATWFASGVNGGGPKLVEAGDLDGLLDGFTKSGVPQQFTLAVKAAVARTKEPITLFLPLLWGALKSSSTPPSIIRQELCPAPKERELPPWMADKHTAIGKRAITLFAQKNEAVRATLEYNVPEFRARDVALMAAFYADGTALDRQLDWHGSASLELAGLEADMMKVHCPRIGAHDIVKAVQANLDHLNVIRSRALAARRGVSEGCFDVEEER